MDLNFDVSLGYSYSNPSQKIRVITEGWVLENIYCPSCGEPVCGYENNKPVADFYCQNCVEDFELKSKMGRFGAKITAGAFDSMVSRIASHGRPNFFFMSYIDSLAADDFFVVPKHFMISDIIEKRKPLALTARRAGWVGSYILFSKIPKAGQIYYIENGRELDKKDVLEKWKKTVFLKKVKKINTKGWILDIMNCIDMLGKDEFTLQDMYKFELDLRIIHPENKHIKDKIRQQLQFLRDKGYLEFLEAGKYRLK